MSPKGSLSDAQRLRMLPTPARSRAKMQKFRVGDAVIANMPPAISVDQEVPKGTRGRIVSLHANATVGVEWNVSGGVFVTHINIGWLQSFPAMEQGFEADADPQSIGQYAREVLMNMMLQERHFMADPNYLQLQPQYNARMRWMLHDWLAAVRRKLGFRRETLFLAFNVTDRYLAQVHVPRNKLQLVGVTAFMIASKFEEVKILALKDFNYFTANTYTPDAIIEMEISILNALGFQVAGPTAAHLLDYFVSVHQKHVDDLPGAFERVHAKSHYAEDLGEDTQRKLAWYILELSAKHIMLHRVPSQIAAAALVLSNKLAGVRCSWPSMLARQSGYAENDLATCVGELLEMFNEASPNTCQVCETA